MKYHLKIKERTDAFSCRTTGFYVNCFQPEAKTDVLSADIKTVVRSGRVLDLNGAVKAVLEAEAQAKEAGTKAPEKVAEKPAEKPVVEEKPEPVAPQEPVAPAVPEEAPPAFDLEKATKDELFTFIKEQGWNTKDLGVNNKTTQPKLVAAIQKQLEAVTE